MRYKQLLFSSALILSALTLHAAELQPMKAAVATPPPLQIVRYPTTLRVTTAKPITNRVISKTAVAQLVNQGLQINPAIIQARLPTGPPGKRALLVIMENGGAGTNLDPQVRQALSNLNIRTVTCGNFEFELREGEDVLSLIGRLGNLLFSNAACLNPANWRQQTFNGLQWFNQLTDQALENAVKANGSLLNTQSYYDRVVVMEDAAATPQQVIPVIRQLEPEYVLDIHVLTHGGNETFFGYNHVQFNAASFFDVLKADKDAGRLYIRAVYQMNCVSGTLKDNWIALGAVTVNGTTGLNNNSMPFQYFHYLAHWLETMGMSDASQVSWQEASVYAGPIYALVGKTSAIDASRLIASGSKANANVNTPL
jgi:hypothetical protein